MLYYILNINQLRFIWTT